jgi:hypothetical protein
MTASLQTFARKHMAAIDRLSFEFEILQSAPEEIQTGPDDGMFCGKRVTTNFTTQRPTPRRCVRFWPVFGRCTLR